MLEVVIPILVLKPLHADIGFTNFCHQNCIFICQIIGPV